MVEKNIIVIMSLGSVETRSCTQAAHAPLIIGFYSGTKCNYGILNYELNNKKINYKKGLENQWYSIKPTDQKEKRKMRVDFIGFPKRPMPCKMPLKNSLFPPLKESQCLV